MPALVSDRGALPDMVGGGGCVLPMPARLQPDIRRFPSAGEVQPWVDALCRLWDDPAADAARATGRSLYDEAAQRGRYVDYFTAPRSSEPLFAAESDAI